MSASPLQDRGPGARKIELERRLDRNAEAVEQAGRSSARTAAPARSAKQAPGSRVRKA